MLPVNDNNDNNDVGQLYKEFDTASGENEHYHTTIKCSVDFNSFYKYFVPKLLVNTEVPNTDQSLTD